MAIPTIFTERGTDRISSFDWFDFAAGAGYQRFYLCGFNSSTGGTYALVTKTVYGDIDFTSATAKNNSVERNFDITFNSPVTIAGADAIISYTYTANANFNGYITFTFYHVSTGATETSIGSVVSDTDTSVGAAYLRKLLKATLTKKSFGVGEKLRIEVVITETANNNLNFWFDPLGRQTFTEGGTSATINTTALVDIPFIIDL